jgi:hypothetical protein
MTGEESKFCRYQQTEVSAMKTGPDSKGAPAIFPERRQRPRYRYSVPMTIRFADGSAVRGMSVEISESGVSAMADGLLRIGDTVELEPVAGERMPALVRHKLGQLYGFEFVNPTEEQVKRIGESCKKFGSYRHSFRNAGAGIDFKR